MTWSWDRVSTREGDPPLPHVLTEAYEMPACVWHMLFCQVLDFFLTGSWVFTQWPWQLYMPQTPLPPPRVPPSWTFS